MELEGRCQTSFSSSSPCAICIQRLRRSRTDWLEEAGILRKIDHSEWAAPVVPVPKMNRTICLCSDYKVTINPALQVDQCPLPNPTELMARLTGGKQFTISPQPTSRCCSIASLPSWSPSIPTKVFMSTQDSPWCGVCTCHFPTCNGCNFVRNSWGDMLY